MNAPTDQGVYTEPMTKRILTAAVFLGSLAAGGTAFADDAKPPAEPVASSKCRAVDAADTSKVLAEAEDKLTTKCARLLEAKVKAGACTEAANQGKTLELVTQFDHMIGKVKMRDGKISVTCPKK